MKKFKWAGVLAVVFICFAVVLFANRADEIKADKEALKHISSGNTQAEVTTSADQKEKKPLKRIFTHEWMGMENLESALENLDIRLDGLDDMIQTSVRKALEGMEDIKFDFDNDFDFDFDFDFDQLDIDLDDLDFDFRFDDFDFDFNFDGLAAALENIDFDFDIDFEELSNALDDLDFDFKWDRDKKSEQAEKKKDLKKIK